MTEKTIKNLFDFQRFVINSNLDKIIQDTQSRMPSAFSEDELSFVNAAGAPEIMAYTGEKDPLDQD